MSARFYIPEPVGLGELIVEGPEAHHMMVSRLAAGDVVTLFAGDNREFVAEIVSISKRQVVLTVTEIHDRDREAHRVVWLASALPKADRLDFLIEKATELGAARFIPLLTSRSVVSPKAKAVEKYQRIVIEASKQCGRNRLMAVEPPQSWEAVLSRPDIPARRCILHTTSDTPSSRSNSTAEPTILAIGPEGGWTDAEIEMALENQWQATCLGKTILRIETAALAGLVWALQGNG